VSDDDALFARDASGVLAGGTGGELGLLVGSRDECGLGEAGGDALSDGVCGAFDVAEGHARWASEGMKILALDGGERLVGDAVEFGGGRFAEGHGHAWEDGKGFLAASRRQK
jgi:hypothetical protein